MNNHFSTQYAIDCHLFQDGNLFFTLFMPKNRKHLVF